MDGVSQNVFTVRPPDRWQNHKLLLAIVFSAAAAALFYWADAKFRQRHRVAYQATATIRLTANPESANTLRSLSAESPVDYARCLAEVARQLDRPQTISQVLAKVAHKPVEGLPPTDDIATNPRYEATGAKLREVFSTVRVSEQPAGDAGQEICLTCTLPDQKMAVTVVNALAAHGRSLFQQSCRSKLQGVISGAAAQLGQSQAALSEAQRNLDHFLATIARAEKSHKQSTAAGQPHRHPAELVENPHWIQLQAKVEQLEHQRAVLLMDRTEAHPAVRHIDWALAELRQQLAEVPRWSEAVACHPAQINPQPDSAASPLGEPRGPFDAGQQEATLQQLRQSLADAQQRAAQATLQHQHAIAAAQSVPDVEVRWATGCERIAPPVPLARMLLSAVSCAVALTIGLCLICAGATAETRVTTRAEVEANLPVPVVGVIPGQSPASDAKGFRVRQWLARWGSVLIGAMLVTGALATFAAS